MFLCLGYRRQVSVKSFRVEAKVFSGLAEDFMGIDGIVLEVGVSTGKDFISCDFRHFEGSWKAILMFST